VCVYTRAFVYISYDSNTLNGAHAHTITRESENILLVRQWPVKKAPYDGDPLSRIVQCTPNTKTGDTAIILILHTITNNDK